MTKVVCIVGLGTVGKELLVLCHKKGYTVRGYDIDEKQVMLINSQLNSYIAFTDLEKAINGAEIIVICVSSSNMGIPDISPVISACKEVSKYLKGGELIIIESTVPPSSIKSNILPIFKKSLAGEQKKIYLACCPERLDVGNKKWTIENIPRVLGGIDEDSVHKAKEFYKCLIDAEIYCVSSPEAAMMTKIIENCFRYLNISFVNMLAKCLPSFEFDTEEILKAASTKPFGFMMFYPGLGVGGECIPLSIHILMDMLKDSKCDVSLLINAKKINEGMIYYVKDVLVNLSKKININTVTVIGLSYKGGCNITKNSMAFRLISLLKGLGDRFEIYRYDHRQPNISDFADINDVLRYSDCLIIANNDPVWSKVFSSYNLKHSNVKCIIDCYGVIDEKDLMSKLQILYWRLGKSKMKMGGDYNYEYA